MTGDYWFDTSNFLWKRYNGASFVEVSRIHIGLVIATTTAAFAAQSTQADAPHSSAWNIFPKFISATMAGQIVTSGTLTILGKPVSVSTSAKWTMVTDFADASDMYSTSLGNNTGYFFYVSDLGELKISDVEPAFSSGFKGFYHPSNTWRAVAYGTTNGSGSLLGITMLPGDQNLFKTNVPVAVSTSVSFANFSFSSVGIFYSDVTGSTLVVNNFGRPVMLSLVGLGVATASLNDMRATFLLAQAANGSARAEIRFKRNGVIIARFAAGFVGAAFGGAELWAFPAALTFIDAAPGFGPTTYLIDVGFYTAGNDSLAVNQSTFKAIIL